MKKLMFLLIGLLMLPIMLMAQDTGIPNIPESFATLGGIAALLIAVVGLVKKWLSLTGIWAQVVSWVLAIAVCYGGWLLKFGLFGDVVLWYIPAVYGIAVGLISNGIFSLEFVKAILRLFKLEPPKNAIPK
jgi:hypothetical protein